jgi:hypothetical protein
LIRIFSLRLKNNLALGLSLCTELEAEFFNKVIDESLVISVSPNHPFNFFTNSLFT